MSRPGNRRGAWPAGPFLARVRWAGKTIPLSEVTGERRAASATAGAASNAGRPPATPVQGVPDEGEDLRRLDSVIHDFLACLDTLDQHAPPEGVGSENAERFRRILEYVPPKGGPVLGPPVLCGMSPAIGLESLFGFLGSLRKTGMLRIRSDDTLFMVSVVRGDVVHAVCHPRPAGELLGSILLRMRAIDAERLRAFFERCGPSAGRLGEALNRQELVSTEALREALELQLQMLFDRLLATRAAEWCFHEGEATLSYIHLRMNATSVLLESARKRDEDGAG